jgi:SAM-dependent methyltransferase
MLEGHGVACWTLDIDPEVIRWGATGRHVIAPIEQAATHFHAAMFDTVLLSGVFGFGIDDVKAQEAAIAACAAVLKPGGLLVLGWNADLGRSLRCRDQQPTDLTRRFRIWPFPLLDTYVAVGGGRSHPSNRITKRPFCEELHGHFRARFFDLTD